MTINNVITVIVGLVAMSPALTHATVTQADPGPGAGVPYFWTVSLGQTDFGTASNHVGAWSWEDDELSIDAGAPVGWTHTSHWVALTLTNPSTFTFRLEQQAGVSWPGPGNPGRLASTASMFPSFTLWANWDNDGVDNDTYNNRGNTGWAEDLVYLDHYDNSTLSAVERSWTLPAGNYTLALGSNAPAEDFDRQGYLASFTTVVPEPGTGMLLLTSLLALGLRRRRTA